MAPLPAKEGLRFHDRSRRRRPVFGDIGLEPRAVRLTVDDEVAGVVFEGIDGALSEERIVEGVWTTHGSRGLDEGRVAA
jgi:hypothetical protein